MFALGSNFGTSHPQCIAHLCVSDLSEEHRHLFAASKKFAVDEIVPHAAHYDRQMEFPWKIIQKAHANGFMNLDVPAEYGKRCM